MRFTLVFDGDLRKFPKNPFKTETPFGTPKTAGVGDGLAELDEAREWLEACLGFVEGRGPPNWDGIREFLRR